MIIANALAKNPGSARIGLVSLGRRMHQALSQYFRMLQALSISLLLADPLGLVMK